MGIENALQDYQVGGVTVRIMKIGGNLSTAASTPNDGWVTVANLPRFKNLPKALTKAHRDFFRAEIVEKYGLLGVDLPKGFGEQEASDSKEESEPEPQKEEASEQE